MCLTSARPSPTFRPSSALRTEIHRVAYHNSHILWALKYGSWPDHFIDHIEHDTLDNGNIRAATRQENGQNRRPTHGCSSSFIGVGWHNQHKKWAAKLTLNGHRIHIGLFNDEREATLARDAAARLACSDFAYLNFPAAESEGVELPERVVRKIETAR